MRKDFNLLDMVKSTVVGLTALIVVALMAQKLTGVQVPGSLLSVGSPISAVLVYSFVKKDLTFISVLSIGILIGLILGAVLS